MLQQHHYYHPHTPQPRSLNKVRKEWVRSGEKVAVFLLCHLGSAVPHPYYGNVLKTTSTEALSGRFSMREFRPQTWSETCQKRTPLSVHILERMLAERRKVGLGLRLAFAVPLAQVHKYVGCHSYRKAWGGRVLQSRIHCGPTAVASQTQAACAGPAASSWSSELAESSSTPDRSLAGNRPSRESNRRDH